ncbi:hypothetical protein FOCC_FOCC004352 [Frankliniella occidentalis]|nr:hypothetical protein FOCC_FOCC004352 [Frankliniella occidentalis]
MKLHVQKKCIHRKPDRYKRLAFVNLAKTQRYRPPPRRLPLRAAQHPLVEKTNTADDAAQWSTLSRKLNGLGCGGDNMEWKVEEGWGHSLNPSWRTDNSSRPDSSPEFSATRQNKCSGRKRIPAAIRYASREEVWPPRQGEAANNKVSRGKVKQRWSGRSWPSMSTVATLRSLPGVPELYVVASVDEHSSKYHGFSLRRGKRYYYKEWNAHNQARVDRECRTHGAGGSELEAPSWRLRAARSSELEAPSWKLQTGGSELEAPSWRVRAGGSELEAPSWKLQTR